MNLDEFEPVGSTDDLTKYEHPTETVTAYEVHDHDNDPVLYVRKLGQQQWLAMLFTNGSFTQMKASTSDFSRALADGKRLLQNFGRKS